MVSTKIVGDLRRVWEFVSARTGVPLSHTMKSLGIEKDGRIVAGVLYENWNGVNLWMHAAIDPGESFTTKFVRYAFEYPFLELRARRLTVLVEESNRASLRLVSRLGFRVEARLAGAASDGGDALIHVMTPADCRILLRDASMAPSRATVE